MVLNRLLRLAHADPYGDIGAYRTSERLAKLQSPRYVVAKLKAVAYEWLHPDHPWLTANAISWLDANIRPQHTAFEWGSGASTAWLARRIRRLVSVEHHSAWHDRVRTNLARAGIENVDYRLVPESQYVSAIDEFPDGHFDFILVDGLFRDATLERAIPKIASGGWLILDNANWYMRSSSKTPHSRRPDAPPYSDVMDRVEAALAPWPCLWTTNGINDTAIVTKPAS
jgi:predicted O-methyltransferase YrrM